MIAKFIRDECKQRENKLMKDLNNDSPLISDLFKYILENKYSEPSNNVNYPNYDKSFVFFEDKVIVKYESVRKGDIHEFSFEPIWQCPYQLLVLKRATPEQLATIRNNGWDIGEL